MKVSSTAGSCIPRPCLGLRIYRPDKAGMTYSNMGPVCLLRSSDITKNLDIFQPFSPCCEDTASFEDQCQEQQRLTGQHQWGGLMENGNMCSSVDHRLLFFVSLCPYLAFNLYEFSFCSFFSLFNRVTDIADQY